MAEKRKSAFMINLEYAAFRAVAGLTRALPLHAAYALSDFCSTLAFHLDRKHGPRATRHILHSGFKTDPKEAKKLALASFRHMGKVFVEIVKFDQIITKENFYEHVSVADNYWSRQLCEPETTRQVIITTAHIGNWELAGGCHSYYTKIPMTSIMRPLGNPKIGAYFYKRRCGFGDHETVSKEMGLRPLLLAHKKGRNITIVADQHASSHEGVDVEYFGHPVCAHATPALLHLKTGTPIAMPFLVRKDNDFHFELYCPEPYVCKPTGNKAEDVKTIVQAYTSMIESMVRLFPDQWLWAHRRWLDCGRPGSWPRKPKKDKNAANEAGNDDKGGLRR